MRIVVNRLYILLKKPICFSAHEGIFQVIVRRNNHGFIDGLENTIESKVSEVDVNKRISGQELTYNGKNDRIIFSANQVGVNRPVEDRWIASHFGEGILNSFTFSSSDHKDVGEPSYGGTLFAVVDGHGGHACAHAVNLLHPDYIVCGLLPPEACEHALNNIRRIHESHTPRTICELAEPLWSTPGAIATSESDHIGFMLRSSKDISLSRPDDRTMLGHSLLKWGPWGPWGPLPSSVRDVHVGHIRRFLEEVLSTSAVNEAYFDENENGDLCDPEGFIVAQINQVKEVASESNSQQFSPFALRKISSQANFSSFSTESQLKQFDKQGKQFLSTFDQLVNEQRDRISNIAGAIRNGLRRMDLDMSTSALPSFRGPALDKALLRIVFAGCVATTAYIPFNQKELYVSQVGDCGAVLGRYSPPEESAFEFSHASNVYNLTSGQYIPEHWESELLINPHVAENELDVSRLKSSHPLYESEFLIRDDRLLGELMPLRAFGDIRFKWSMDELKHIARLLDLPPNYPITSKFYSSPPYLIATPQVIWKPLKTLQDHFLIMGTDGLWDMISPCDAVRVVTQHWFDYKGDPSICGPGDTAASRLIRTALGGEEMDANQIALHFSIPASIARYYRDDISVIVIYLPTIYSNSS